MADAAVSAVPIEPGQQTVSFQVTAVGTGLRTAQPAANTVTGNPLSTTAVPTSGSSSVPVVELIHVGRACHPATVCRVPS